MNNGKYGQGTRCTKIGADSLVKNTPNAPKFICPICLLKPKSLGFQWKNASLGVHSPCFDMYVQKYTALKLDWFSIFFPGYSYILFFLVPAGFYILNKCSNKYFSNLVKRVCILFPKIDCRVMFIKHFWTFLVINIYFTVGQNNFQNKILLIKNSKMTNDY